jgi:TatD DNase family protein
VTSRWIDNHCHLEAGLAGDEVVAAAADAGVERLVTVGTDVASSQRMIAIARSHPGRVWATAGVHPHDASGGIDGLAELLDAPEVVAVGECGLDHHYDHSPRAAQREVFEAQIDLAHEHDLALVIHTREAWPDTFDILTAAGLPERTVFHCFTGGPAEADRCLELGAYLSFSGILSFPSATELRAAAARCPLDRILVETDSPYLAPVPHRGKRNQPAWVPLVGAALADALGTAVDDVAAATWANAAALYGLPAAPEITSR